MRSPYYAVFAIALSVTCYGQTVNNDILPGSTGLRLGNTNQRWKIYAQSLDLANGCTINGQPCGLPGLIQINGILVTLPNLNNTLPAATAGNTLCSWQTANFQVSVQCPQGNVNWASPGAQGTVAPNTGVFTVLNGVYNADAISGADWCAKVTAADSALSTTRGLIMVSPAAGVSTCSGAATLSSNHSLQLVGGAFVASCSGILVQNASNVNITGANNASVSLPNSCGDGSRPIRILTSTNVKVEGLEINGNGNNQSSGEQSHDIIVFNSNRVKIRNNYLHDAQGDGININTDSGMTTGCNDILVEGNSFTNIGRQFLTLTGYGCNDVRWLANHFTIGTQVSTSTSTGNSLHVEGDNAGTSFNRVTIADNDVTGATGTCISSTSQNTNPIIGLVISNNQCQSANSSANAAAGIVVLMAQDVNISGNTVNMSGATAGSDGILFQEASSWAAQAHRSIISGNTIEGPSQYGIEITSSAISGVPQAVIISDNIINSVAGAWGIRATNNFSDVSIHDNILTNLQQGGIRLESTARFHLHHNTIRDFGLNGSAASGIQITCNGSFTIVGPGEVESNRVGSATTTGMTGIAEQCSTASNIYVFNNDVTANATGVLTGTGFTNAFPPANLSSLSPLTIGTTQINEDSAGSVLALRNTGNTMQFRLFYNYPSIASYLLLTANFAGGSPGMQAVASAANLNPSLELSSCCGTGSVNLRTAFNSGAIAWRVDTNGHLVASGTKGQHLNTFGANNDLVGTCTAAAATTCTVTFTTNYGSAPVCTVTDQTSIVALKALPSTSSLVITTSGSSSDVFSYICAGNPN